MLAASSPPRHAALSVPFRAFHRPGLLPVQGTGLRVLAADDTRRIASDLIGSNKQAINILREQGSCDISFGLPGLARFRVNIFIQRGSCAVVMRVIPTTIPGFPALAL